MVKVGDKVRSLVDFSFTREGWVYTVKSLGSSNNGIWLENGDFLTNDEFELVEDEPNKEYIDLPMADTPTEEEPESEELTNTERYKTGSGKQLFDVLEDDLLNYIEARGFYKANIIKYTHRYKHKGGIEDLKKVKVYVDQLIKLEEKQNEI